MISTYVTEAMQSSSWIRKMFEVGQELKKKYGVENVYDLTLGNPIIEPPDEFFEVLEMLSLNKSSGMHRYMSNAGFTEVRERIANHLTKKNLLKTNFKHIIMTVGAAGGMNVILRTILNPGDEVIIFAPYFAEYLFYTQNHQGKIVISETTEDFDLDLDDLDRKITTKTKAIIINSPNNPTGKTYSEEKINGLVDLLSMRQKKMKRPLFLISDEPYREIVFDDIVVPSVVAKYKNSFLVYSWSKSLSIPGERIGYIAVNPNMDDVDTVIDGLIFCNRILGFVNAPATMQLAVSNLLTATVRIKYYKEKRDRIYQALTAYGYDVVKPTGTFYVFPKCPTADELEFIERAKSERVLVVPGVGFGRSGYFRISYSTDDRTIEKALDQFGKLI